MVSADTATVPTRRNVMSGSTNGTTTSSDGLVGRSFIGEFPGSYHLTVETTGLYDIVANGAQGGLSATDSSLSAGGEGAEAGGEVMLTKGETLTIIVGQQGQGGPYSGGGGGASYVVDSITGLPLVVAGGGGGASHYDAGQAGQAVISGGSGGGSPPSAVGGSGGSSGQGGQGGNGHR